MLGVGCQWSFGGKNPHHPFAFVSTLEIKQVSDPLASVYSLEAVVSSRPQTISETTRIQISGPETTPETLKVKIPGQS